MNTKYLVIGTLIVIIGLFLAMHQSNKNSAEKREQEMIAYQQKMERERLEEANKEKALELKQVEVKKTELTDNQLISEKKDNESELTIKQDAITQTNQSNNSDNKYSEEDWMVICKSTAGAANAIMSSRQRGVSMTEMMDKVVHPAEPAIKDIVKAFVIEAYNRPRYETPEYQRKSVLDFENYAHLTCIKARK